MIFKMETIFTKKNKAGQAQVIVTVLLILIVLATVGIVGVFVTNLVRDNLQGTDCFKTIGSVSINKEYTNFDSDNAILNLSISRTVEEFNLTGLSVSISAGASASVYEILPGDPKANEIAVYGDDLTDPNMTGAEYKINLPNAQETFTYQIKTITNVDGVSIAPIIGKGKQCEVVGEMSL